VVFRATAMAGGIITPINAARGRSARQLRDSGAWFLVTIPPLAAMAVTAECWPTISSSASGPRMRSPGGAD
jgi:hypothetical protein